MRRHGAWAIAGTFIGTVVGAGFASGQETLRFFTAFGPWGLAGLGVAVVLFAFFGSRTLSLGREYGASSHREIVLHAVGGRFGLAVDWLLTVVLLATAAAMASGAAATMNEQYGWARWIGGGGMALVTVGTVLVGIQGVVAAISFVAPLLIVAILAIGISTLVAGPGLNAAFAWSGASELAPIPFWGVAALLYVAYNLLLAIPVLGPLGTTAAGLGAIRWGGLLGGLGLGLGATVIHLVVAASMPDAAAVDIPMLYTARTLPPWVPVAYSVLLLAEVYTTAVAMLYGFAARIGPEGGGRFWAATIGGGIVTAAGSMFSFSRVVGTLYPLLGVIGIVLLIGSLRRPRPFW